MKPKQPNSTVLSINNSLYPKMKKKRSKRITNLLDVKLNTNKSTNKKLKMNQTTMINQRIKKKLANNDIFKCL
jgi:hypothetical protein